jgi:uncharacterized protein (UPF0276 family)
MNSSAIEPAVASAVGIGLRGPHMREIMERRPFIGWLEIHAENYFANAPARAALHQLRNDYPLSLHGVGLSLGSAEGLSVYHLDRLKQLTNEFQPMLVSEHLSFSVVDGAYLNDLLPLPYTEEALAVVAGNVNTAQDALQRRILVENPSVYLRYKHSTLSEAEFLTELCRRTGCGILCDVNNAYVAANNVGLDAAAWLAALPADAIGEIHLAGHHEEHFDERTLLIDDHGAPITAAVWDLYQTAIALYGMVPTLIERDKNIPALDELLGEAADARTHAHQTLEQRHVRAA